MPAGGAAAECAAGGPGPPGAGGGRGAPLAAATGVVLQPAGQIPTGESEKRFWSHRLERSPDALPSAANCSSSSTAHGRGTTSTTPQRSGWPVGRAAAGRCVAYHPCQAGELRLQASGAAPVPISSSVEVIRRFVSTSGGEGGFHRHGWRRGARRSGLGPGTRLWAMVGGGCSVEFAAGGADLALLLH